MSERVFKSVFAVALFIATGSKSGLAADDPFASFPLQEEGVVVGAGAGMHALGLNSPKLTGVASTAFAYVGWLPFTYFLAPETRKYCASYQHSQDEADKAAARRAFPNDAKSEERIKSDPAAILSRTGWRVGVRGSCWLVKFGIFAALPASFDADIRPSSDTASVSKTLRPLGSAGIFLAPLPYLHVLIGVTYSNAALVPKDAEADQQLLSLFFGLGTTIDAVGAALE